MNATQRFVVSIVQQAIEDLESTDPGRRQQARAILSNREVIHSLCNYLTLDLADLALPGSQKIH